MGGVDGVLLEREADQPAVLLEDAAPDLAPELDVALDERGAGA